MTITRKTTRVLPMDLALLQREITQLFERLAEFHRTERAPVTEWIPCVDVWECEGNLTVVIEVPGLTAESVRLVFRDHHLVISGERRERRGHDGGAFLCMERPHGRFTRTIPIDIAVDVQQAAADLAHGLLTIRLPRLRDRRGRETEIPVKRERA